MLEKGYVKVNDKLKADVNPSRDPSKLPVNSRDAIGQFLHNHKESLVTDTRKVENLGLKIGA